MWNVVNLLTLTIVFNVCDGEIIVDRPPTPSPEQKPNITVVEIANGTSWRGTLRIEVDGKWGRVCHRYLDSNFAKVVCRSVGLPGDHAIILTRQDERQLIHIKYEEALIDDVRCYGTEASLGECYYTRRKKWCSYRKVGIDCGAPLLTKADVEFALDDKITTNYNETLRYTRGRGNLAVRVENNPRWGRVCQKGFDELAARVVCRMLGYPSDNAKPVWHGASGGWDFTRVESWISSVRCTGNENHLMDCVLSNSWGREICMPSVGVDCEGHSALTFYKLQSGSSSANGIVKLAYHNVSGAPRYPVKGMCSDGFTQDVASAVCAAFGFPNAPVVVLPASMFENTRYSALNWLEDYYCLKGMKTLADCRFEHLGANCDRQAAVDCNNTLPFNDIRLIGGYDQNSGRLELKRENTWKSVCKKDFGYYGASVACKMLGLPFQNAKVYQNLFGTSDTAGTWSDNFHCSSTSVESAAPNLFECSVDIYSEFCDHSSDIGITCYDDPTGPTLPDKTVRFIGGYAASSGHVEILYQQKWRTICNDKFDNNAAAVVCRMAGFSSEEAVVVRTNRYGWGLPGRYNILLDDVVCDGTEDDIMKCDHNPVFVHDCRGYEAVAVDCFGLRTKTNMTIRLTNKRVEVLHNNQWGSVCDDSIGENELKVICQQLSLPSENVRINKDGHRYNMDGPIWLDEVKCQGHETNIGQCRHDPLGEHNCDHAEDLFIECA